MAKKKKKTKAPRKSKKRAPRSDLSKDLEILVGHDVYSTWVKMLAELVPWGRTERLSILVAAMLQFSASAATRRGQEDNSAAVLLQESAEIGMDYEEQERLMPLIEVLFKDAGVKWKRTNARGQGYSIADEALNQFLRWDFMPWE